MDGWRSNGWWDGWGMERYMDGWVEEWMNGSKEWMESYGRCLTCWLLWYNNPFTRLFVQSLIHFPSAFPGTGCCGNRLRRSVQTSLHPQPQIPASHLRVVNVKNKAVEIRFLHRVTGLIFGNRVRSSTIWQSLRNNAPWSASTHVVSGRAGETVSTAGHTNCFPLILTYKSTVKYKTGIIIVINLYERDSMINLLTIWYIVMKCACFWKTIIKAALFCG